MALKIKMHEAIMPWTSTSFLKTLDSAGGEDIVIEVSSPGGSILAGLRIYNALLAYRKEYPKATITVRSFGLIASMATVIVMAAHKIEVNTGSVWMVHNALMVAIGDYKDMRKAADILEGFSQMISSIYSEQANRNKEKKTCDYYRKLMDEETWLFGKEIVDAGFADTTWGDPVKDSDKSEKIKKAKTDVKKAIKDNADSPNSFGDLDKLAAFMGEQMDKQGMFINYDRNDKIKGGAEVAEDNKDTKVRSDTVNKGDLEKEYNRGFADGKEAMRNLVAKATKYFSSDYPEAIKNLAIKVINEEGEISSLESAVAIYDSLKENKKSEDAKVDSASVKDVVASKLFTPGLGNDEGLAYTENDFQNEIKRMKAMGRVD